MSHISESSISETSIAESGSFSLPPPVSVTVDDSGIITRHTQAEMIASKAAYLPTDELFEAAHVTTTNLYALLSGLSGELLRSENFLALYNSEFIPDNSTTFLEEWESTLGIPDECFPGPAESDPDVRRQHVLVKLASLGVQTVDDFESLAVIMGLNDVQVIPGADAGLPDTIGDNEFSIAFPASFSGADDRKFTIVVRFPFDGNKFPLIFPFSFGEDQFGILKCLYTKLKPANCDIIFQTI